MNENQCKINHLLLGYRSHASVDDSKPILIDNQWTELQCESFSSAFQPSLQQLLWNFVSMTMKMIKTDKTLRSSHWAGGEWPWVKWDTEAAVLLFCNNTETFQNYYHEIPHGACKLEIATVLWILYIQQCELLNVICTLCVCMCISNRGKQRRWAVTLICVKIMELFYKPPFLSSSPCSLSLLISCLFTSMLFTIMCFQSIYSLNERHCKSIMSLYHLSLLCSLCLYFSITPFHFSRPPFRVQCFPEPQCQCGMLMCIDVYEIRWNLQRQHEQNNYLPLTWSCYKACGQECAVMYVYIL